MATNKIRPIHPGEIIREEYLVPNLQNSYDLKLAEKANGKRIEQEVRPLEKIAA